MPDPIDAAPEHGLYMQEPYADEKLALENPEAEEPFGNEESAEVKYRTLTWWYVLLLTAATIANVHASAREIQAMWNQYDTPYHSPTSSDQYEGLTRFGNGQL